jgi:general secretion pathway protein I
MIPLPTPKRPSEGGFGLLEAIVALALMASVGVALFSWMRQGIETAARLRDAQARADTQLHALALIEKVNPATRPEGELRVSGLAVKWNSVLIKPMRPVVGFLAVSGAATPWQVGLYRMEVRAESPAGAAAVTEFSLTRVGWQPGTAVASGAPVKP